MSESDDGKKFKEAICIELKDLGDLARILSSTRFDNELPKLLYFEHERSGVLGMLYFSPGYYEYTALPLFYYVRIEPSMLKPFFYYKADEQGERFGFSDNVKIGFSHYPVIRLKGIPPFFKC